MRGDGRLSARSAIVGLEKPERSAYTIADLETATGISPRNIRYYITQGLVPPARGRGVGATYTRSHLLRLLAINSLKERHLPLAEIRQRLEGLKDAELEAMLNVETAPAEDRWRRVQLHPDVELHVRERSGAERNYALDNVVDTIVRQAKILIERLGESS
jgi:DNA-binding transcriptional MerR regulator